MVIILTQKVFRKLLNIEDAKNAFHKNYSPTPVGVERIPLDTAHNFVIAENLEASIDVPPFDRATMDGFAVCAEDTFLADDDKPVTLEIMGKIDVGEYSELVVQRGEALEISTGAPIPKGANAVVMVEHTNVQSGNLKVYKPFGPGENIMAAGSDIRAGELILRKGTLMTPRETGVLAALGVTKVKCYRRPKIAIISSGNELVSPGSRLETAKIYDINARTISDSILECGGEPLFLGIARDNLEDIRSRIEEGFEAADMVITSGGTSAGVGDLVYQVVEMLGKPGIVVHGVSVKPGKPTIIGVVDGKPIFGLPGNPTSALMIFDIFVRPAIRSMAGLREEERAVISARTSQKFYSSDGRREFMPVNVVRTEEGGYTAYPILTGSGAITTLAEADGFIEIQETRRFLREGELVKVNLFSQILKPADLMIIGSHCVGVDLILNLLSKTYYDTIYKTINTGSSGGLSAIRRGEADLAGIHLLDDKTGEYNLPFLKRFEVDKEALLIRGYNRTQGLITAKNNPLKITSFKDLVRRDVTLINRNPGSGTRILLDFYLSKIASEEVSSLKDVASSVNGYKLEAKSHTAVAVAILRGKADVGLGIETVAEQYGLSFVQISEERYDFAVRADRMNKKSVKAFLSVLRSEEFKARLRRIKGLSPTEETGDVLYP
jgi:putative molybdopterin biosynthesis protein